MRPLTISPKLVATVHLVLVGLMVSTATADGLPRETLDRVKQATVYVKVKLGPLQASGTGFLVGRRGRDGYIATNAHVISFRRKLGNKQVRLTAKQVTVVLNSGDRQERVETATVVGSDVKSDLAILKVTADNLPKGLSVRADPNVHETQEVYLFGFPFGPGLTGGQHNPEITVSRAAISSIRKNRQGQVAALQIDGSINPGNSGGPIVRANGELVGIAVAKVRGTQIGLALPTRRVRQVLLGRLTSVTFQRLRQEESSAVYRVHGQAIDPLGKMKQVEILFGASNAADQTTSPDANGSWPRLEGTVHSLEIPVKNGRFQRLVRLQANPDQGVEYLVQPSYQRADGRQIHVRPSLLKVKLDHTPAVQAPAPVESGTSD